MRCINFDEKFEQYAMKWMQQNAGLFHDNIDRMEAQMPAVYEKWLKTPADWLSGLCPGQYFAQYDHPQRLVDWLISYVENSVPVPDQLMERITMLGDEAERCLMALLADDEREAEIQIMAISLLAEMDSVKPMALYIKMIQNGHAREERVDHAAQALVAMGSDVVAPILRAVQTASRAGREAFLDILCNFPGDEAIYELAISLFHEEPSQRALYASLLGKLGDERALSTLQSAAREPGLAYLDYIEICNAIEMLGGDAPEAGDFSGDPGYESLRRMK